MSGRPCPAGLMARIVKSVDFERVLRARSRASTHHFAVHHVAGEPSPARAKPQKLSTVLERVVARPVDESGTGASCAACSWVGVVVPKRHAKRAVTRSLLKRQMYAATARHRDRLAPGLWIVRLRSPIDRTLFPSAASASLRRVVRDELEALLDAARTGAAA